MQRGTQMSRAYWVKLAATVSEVINEGDSAVHRVKLDSILSEQEMTELLEACLGEEDGWEKGDDGKYRKTLEDGTEMVWDVEKGEVEASIEVSKEITEKVEVRGQSDEDYADHKERATRNAEKNLQNAKSHAKSKIRDEADKIRQEATEKLTGNEQERNEEINEVVQKAYAEAVKRKARQLGSVTSQTEGTNAKGQYELTITVSE
jgi:hypothetical protein